MKKNEIVLLLSAACFAVACGNRPLGSRDGGGEDSPVEQSQPDSNDGVSGRDGPGGDDADSGADVPPPPSRPPEVAAWEDDRKLTPGARITFMALANDRVLAGTTAGDVVTASDWREDVPLWLRADNFMVSGASAFQLPNLPVAGLVSSPSDGLTIWVGFFGADLIGHKVWWTQKGGQTWIELTASPVEDVRSLSINPLNPAVLYAVTTSRLLRSTDQGANWRWWTPDESDPHVNGNCVTAGCQGSGSDGGIDGGTDAQVPDSGNVSAVAFAAEPGRVWTGHLGGAVWVSSVPCRVQNASECTWEPAGAGTPATQVNHLSVVVDSAGEHVALACASSNADGVWLSDDGGQTWRNAHGAGLPAVVTVFSVSINPRFPTTLYAFTSAGAFRSDDAGATWW